MEEAKKPEVEVNKFEWADYLVLAQRLVKEAEESSKRTAISRAYYYVFNLAKDRAVTNGLVLRADSSHKLTWEFYLESPDLTCQRLGLLGQRLRDLRVIADYDLPFKGRLERESPESINKANKFVQELSTVNPRLPNSQSQRRRV